MNITVVGAGVVGCAVAYELASRGAHVRVVDPRPIGTGATYASAGMLPPHIEGHHPSLLTCALASLALYDQFIAGLRAQTDRVIEYERDGTLQVATSAEDVARLEQIAGELRARGTEHRLLDGAAARRLEPGLSVQVRAALLIPEHGYVAAGAMTAALADVAQRLGVRFGNERVLGITGHANGVTVETSGGAMASDAVVLAAGSWSAGVAGITDWPPPVKPVRGQLLYLRAESRPASRILWSSGCYLVPWANGTVLVGATVEDAGFDEQATAGGVQQLLAAALAVVPSLSAAGFREVRVGLRPKTGDDLPIIGPSSTMPHVFYATGHYRNGILLTPLTAALIGDLVMDGHERPELSFTRPARFGL